MSLKVLRKIRSRLFSRCWRSHSCLNSVKRSSIGNRPKLKEPTFSDATSGAKRIEGWMRSSMVMKGEPPLVRLTTALVRALICGKNLAKPRGSGRGGRDRVTRVQVHDGRARFGGADCRIGDFLRRHRQVRRHRRRVDRARDGAGDDDFAHGGGCGAGEAHIRQALHHTLRSFLDVQQRQPLGLPVPHRAARRRGCCRARPRRGRGLAVGSTTATMARRRWCQYRRSVSVSSGLPAARRSTCERPRQRRSTRPPSRLARPGGRGQQAWASARDRLALLRAASLAAMGSSDSRSSYSDLKKLLRSGVTTRPRRPVSCTKSCDRSTVKRLRHRLARHVQPCREFVLVDAVAGAQQAAADGFKDGSNRPARTAKAPPRQAQGGQGARWGDVSMDMVRVLLRERTVAAAAASQGRLADWQSLGRTRGRCWPSGMRSCLRSSRRLSARAGRPPQSQPPSSTWPGTVVLPASQ
jgi:hypothetical protein